jgi:glycosyltransferase involved in cell wall biosynthesis
VAADLDGLPTIAVVTPTYQHAHVLERAMKSVLDQGYPHLEYVVVDGGSHDGTHELLDRYRDRLHAVVEEPDRGPHDALDKGFALTRGTVMGWLNADDMLLPGSLLLVGTLFRDYPDVRWLTGEYFSMDPDGRPALVTHAPRWTRWHLLSRLASGWIAQESTFFRRDLWDEAGASTGDIWGHGEERSFPHAFDFELWGRFSRYAKLQTVSSPIGVYGYIPGQQGVAHYDAYTHFAEVVRERERPRTRGEHIAAYLADLSFRLRRFRRLRLVIASALGAPSRIVFDIPTYEYRRGQTRIEPVQRLVCRLLDLKP